jgi:hypothetical protein
MYAPFNTLLAADISVFLVCGKALHCFGLIFGCIYSAFTKVDRKLLEDLAQLASRIFCFEAISCFKGTRFWSNNGIESSWGLCY